MVKTWAITYGVLLAPWKREQNGTSCGTINQWEIDSMGERVGEWKRMTLFTSTHHAAFTRADENDEASRPTATAHTLHHRERSRQQGDKITITEENIYNGLTEGWMRAYHRWSSQWSRHWSNSASQSSASQPPACSARPLVPYTCSEIVARNGLHYPKCLQGSKVSMVLFSLDQDMEGYYTTDIPVKEKRNLCDSWQM